MHRRRGLVVAALVATALLTTNPPALTPATATDTVAPSTMALTWEACGDAECSRLNVPLDESDASLGTISLALTRVQHTGSTRLGTVVVNPGGPGVPAVDYAAYLAQIAPRLAQYYDIVAFDPRGVGESAPITCMTGPQTTRWLLTDPTPDSAAEARVLMSRGAAIGDGCLTMSPRLARHVGSEATVRDMDRIRAALGDEHLNLVAFSYGTYLGTRYAELFPDRVGRFVLDGALDPSLDSMQLSQGQSAGFQRALERFARDCVHHRACISRTPSGVIEGINRLLASLDAKPMPGGSMGRLDEAQALAAIFHSLYSRGTWPMLRTGLAQTRKNSGAALQWLADESWGRTGPTRYATNANSAFYAISCWDFPAAPNASGLATAALAWSRSARVPAMAAASAWGNAPCSSWFGHSEIRPHPASTTTTAPILIIGTRYDPATPYRWAVALAEQLPTSSLLTYEGDGHTAFGGESACVDAAVNAFMIDGAIPARGARCR